MKKHLRNRFSHLGYEVDVLPVSNDRVTWEVWGFLIAI